MNKPWCIEPFINLSHTTDGWYQPCCVAQVDRNSNRNTFEMSPLEYMNSDYVRKMRKDMLDGTESTDIKYACKSCILAEKSGTISRRQTQNQKYNINDTVAHIEENNYKIDSTHLQYVNLKVLGNICNLKCIMCNPKSSSKIAAEYKKYKIEDIENAIQVSYDDSNKSKYFEDLDKILESIDRFSLIGGEAFVHPDFKEIFEIVKSNKNSKNIELFIITNGTVLPEYVLENIGNFRQVTLNFSVDGIEDKAEYIRNGTEWQEFDRNVKIALRSDANVVFTSAAQLLSIGYLHDICDYILSLGVSHNKLNNLFNPVTYPKIHNATYLPKDIKDIYRKKYRDLNWYGINPNIDKTLKMLEVVEDQRVFDQFITRMKRLDTIRGNCLIDVFPEFEKYYHE